MLAHTLSILLIGPSISKPAGLRGPSTFRYTGKFPKGDFMERKPQTLANHAKFDPAFHFFLLPVLTINVIVVAVELFRFPSVLGGWLLLISIALFVIIARMRVYATQLQDRIIRLEEHLRLAALLPENLRLRIVELTDSQIVGLRFASDGELAGL